MIRSLNSNAGLAEQLAAYHVLFGDWRELFRYVDRMEAVTKADIRRVANELFKESNRVVGRIETAPRPAAPTGRQARRRSRPEPAATDDRRDATNQDERPKTDFMRLLLLTALLALAAPPAARAGGLARAS